MELKWLAVRHSGSLFPPAAAVADTQRHRQRRKARKSQGRIGVKLAAEKRTSAKM